MIMYEDISKIEEKYKITEFPLNVVFIFDVNREVFAA